MFNREIWMMILSRVDDPLALMRMQTVCKDWSTMIKTILPSHDGWFKLCFKEVPIMWLRKALGGYDDDNDIDGEPLSYWNYESPCSWQRVYSGWKKWHQQMTDRHPIDLIMRDRISKRTFQFTTAENITCMSVTRNMIAIGTNLGAIYVCHILDLHKPFFIAHQEHSVQEVCFWQSIDHIYYMNNFGGKITIVVSSDGNGRLKFWDCCKRRELQTGGFFGGLISTKRDRCDNCISMYENVLSGYRGDYNIIYRRWIHALPENETIVAIEPSLIASAEVNNDERDIVKETLVLTTDHDNMTIYKMRLRWNTNDDGASVIMNIHLKKSLPDTLMASNSEKKFLCLSQDIVFCIFDDMLAISYNDEPWRLFNTIQHFAGKITSACTDQYLQRLLLGTDSGAVYILHFTQNINWRDFDLAMVYKPKLILDNEPIIFLHDGYIDDNYYFIIGGTAKKVHVKKWFDNARVTNDLNEYFFIDSMITRARIFDHEDCLG